MKAMVQERYGSLDVLSLREVDKPVVRENEVLVRVRAASVHPDIWHVVGGVPYVLRLMGSGLLRPKCKIPGTDMAGHVEAVGRTVTRFRPGDEVFGETGRDHPWQNGGAYAEYVSVPEGALERKPANLTFEQAAAVPTSGFIALQNLRDGGQLQPGQRVLINGAGGCVGTFAVQLAKASGAHVTGVDSAGKLDVLRKIGADHVIDYTQEDCTRGSERYDLILDIASNLSLLDCRRVLSPKGVYVLVGHDHFGRLGRRWMGSLPRFMGLLVVSRFVGHLPRQRVPLEAGERLPFLKELLEAGKITPVIDRTYPLGQVPEALRHLQTGSARGKIVITV